MFTVWVGPAPVVVLRGFQVVKKALVSHSEKLSGWPLTPLFRDLVEKEARLPSLLGTGWLGGGLQWGDPELLTWRNLLGGLGSPQITLCDGRGWRGEEPAPGLKKTWVKSQLCSR